jgi:RNA polymerase sigma-70 factor (ECF subfamily)
VQQALDLSGDGGLRAAYTAHGPEIYRFALRGLGDVGMAQDAVQETFLRAWQSASRYDPTLASPRVWLFAIARNVLIDLHRRRSKASWAQVTKEGVNDGPGPVVVDASEAVLARAVVQEALSRLSPDHRQVIVETYLRGRSYEDLGAESNVAAGTLRSRMFYALKSLRATMEEMGVSP